MHRTNMTGKSYDKRIPKLAKVANMKHVNVINLICNLKLSIYEGKDPVYLQKVMRKEAARSYLINLIIYNATLRSELPIVHESDSN